MGDTRKIRIPCYTNWPDSTTQGADPSLRIALVNLTMIMANN